MWFYGFVHLYHRQNGTDCLVNSKRNVFNERLPSSQIWSFCFRAQEWWIFFNRRLPNSVLFWGGGCNTINGLYFFLSYYFLFYDCEFGVITQTILSLFLELTILGVTRQKIQHKTFRKASEGLKSGTVITPKSPVNRKYQAIFKIGSSGHWSFFLTHTQFDIHGIFCSASAVSVCLSNNYVFYLTVV